MVNASAGHWQHALHANDDGEEPQLIRKPRVMTTPSASEPAHFNLIIRNSGKPTFDEQVAVFKSVGASFDGSTQTWWVPLERVLTGDQPGIDALFEAAREHKTSVWLERRSPREA